MEAKNKHFKLSYSYWDCLDISLLYEKVTN